MATEFKLSYTGNQINEKLNKIDSLAAKSELPTKTSQLTNDSGYMTSYTETDPTVPEWAKQPKKPTYTAKEVGLGNVENVRQYSDSNPPPYPVASVNGQTGKVQLGAADVGARPSNWMPTAQEVGALPDTYVPPDQTAAQVGADPAGTATASVSTHNTSTDSHGDLRLELKAISDRLTAFFDSDNQALDELSEIVAYITSNKSLIDAITTSKVNVTDIINNLTTNAANKPLSAAQGVVLKGLIDGLYSGKLDASKLQEAISTALAQAKASGEFDGADGVGIESIKQTTTSTADGGNNVFTVTLTNGEAATFAVKNGSTGGAGADGTSVTVKSVTESSEDGGSNVVEFSDGKTVAIKNGSKGSDGAPDIGQVFAPSPQLAGRAVTVVNSIEEMTDPNQHYALNGYVYECVVTEVSKGYTNQLTAAGWQNNTRINSSGEVKTASGITIATSGLISCVPGDRLRIKSVQKSGDYAIYIAAYNASGTKTGLYKISDAATIDYVEIDMVLDSATFGAFTGIRFCSRTIDGSTIVTINEAIEESTETVYNWISTGEEYAPSDFDAETCTAQDIYTALDILCAKYPGYITKETMGKDESGQLDCNRYVLSAHYYSAWQKNDYPKMYAWKNGSTVVYSLSVSPRIGNTMYSTKHIGTAYAAVTAVDNVNQTRTVNGKTFTRSSANDVEPTLAFVSIVDNAAGTGTVYNEQKAGVAMVSSITAETMSDSKGNSYTRYPMGDRDKDMRRPTVVVIGANEHGPQGDPKDPAIICARMAKDLCECRRADNWLLHYLKNNCMVVMVPVINPYGFTYGYGTGERDGYYNANGVNINRNYDCPGWGKETNAGPAGEYGGSENETQYFMNTISEPNSAVAISIHCLGYTSGVNDGLMHYQGNGFNADKLAEIAQTIYANYNLQLTSYGDAPLATTAKSPTYITQAGAVGGIIEMQAREGELGKEGAALHTARIMEANYTLLLQCVHMWLTDAAV